MHSTKEYLSKSLPLLVTLCSLLLLIGCESKRLEPKQGMFGQKIFDKRLPLISPRHIRELRVRNAELQEHHWKIIGTFHNLEELTLRQCEIDGKHLSYLKELQELRKLVIRVNPKDVADEDMIPLSHLSKLEEFSLGSRCVTDAGIARLSGHRNLAVLLLSCPHVTGEFLKSFVVTGSIRHIDLSACEIGDDKMKHIAKFKYLRGLWLGDTEATDAGLIHVSDNLWLVNVTPSPHMTDEGLLAFRKRLISGRQQARKNGVVVPPDDILFINSQNKEVRGKSPVGGQSERLDELQQSIDQSKP